MNDPQTWSEFWEGIWRTLVSANVLPLIWAVLILIVGWLLAVILSGAAAGLVRKLGIHKHIDNYKKEGDKRSYGSAAEKVTSRIVFWVVLLLTILASLNTLKLNEAAEPIRVFLLQITGFAPRLIGAGFLFLLAWLSASILEYFTRTALKQLKFDEKYGSKFLTGSEAALSEQEVTETKELKPLSSLVGNVVYWVVFLFFIPAILSALNIGGITQPLEKMFTKLMEFVPHLIAAGAILFVGLLIARIVRKAVTGMLLVANLDELGVKAGTHKVFGNKGLSYLVGLVAYVLVAIPVIISALTALKIQALSDSVSGFFTVILAATGNVIGAGLLLFAAFIAGGLVAGIVTQLLESFGFDKLIAALGFAPKSEKSVTPSAVMGKITLIAIMLFASIAACDILGFDGISELLSSFLAFCGNVLVGIVVLMIGIYLSNVAANALRNQNENATILAQVARVAVLIFTGAIALSTMNLDGYIVEIAFASLLGAVCIAVALAFGLGGRDFAAKKLEEWNSKFTKK